MIKVGDRVKFLNDVGGGIVKGFISKTMANVENHDGFDIPYPISQLVNIDAPEMNKSVAQPAVQPEQRPAVPKLVKPEETAKIIRGKDSPDFYFCFVPDDPKNPLAGEISLYLVNDSNFTVLYQYSHFSSQKFRTIKNGRVKPNTKTLLESIGQNDLSELPEYGFQLLFFREEEKEWQKPVSKKFKVNPVKFYKEKSFYSNPFFPKNAMVLQITPNILQTEIGNLTDDDLRKVVQAKEEKPEEKMEQKKKPEDVIEVDLHIQELVDNTAGLESQEILELQMAKVESEMRAAIRTGVKRIVFIHGVGQGVLKQEVARVLKSKFSKYYFQDASFREYGYGATMVILKKG
jgi:hypothetical protein